MYGVPANLELTPRVQFRVVFGEAKDLLEIAVRMVNKVAAACRWPPATVKLLGRPGLQRPGIGVRFAKAVLERGVDLELAVLVSRLGGRGWPRDTCRRHRTRRPR